MTYAEAVKHLRITCDEGTPCDACIKLKTCRHKEALAVLRRAEPVMAAVEELLEVADLRGDTDLPHPADDPKLWTARMQSAIDSPFARKRKARP